jgi:CelD/BcsL family acetyltransferase involved in cellulose biosynthesis
LSPAIAPAPRPLRTPAATPNARAETIEAEVARVDVFVSLAEARRDWDELEAIAGASPYQAFAFADAWFATIGPARRAAPFIVVAREKSGAPLALLPFARRSRGPLGLVEFIGGKHANFNLGLFRPGCAWGAAALLGLLAAAARESEVRVDLYALLSQPRDWQGCVNPLAALVGQASPSFGYKSELPRAFAAWREARYSAAARKKLRRKAERLASMGEVSHRIARDEAEAARMLDALIAQRCERTRRQGALDAYENLEAQAFLRQLSAPAPAGGRPIMELHALMLDERVVATFAALSGRDRLSGLVVAYEAEREIARSSPGELLVHEVVRSAIARGFTTFDLGVGEARYKSECCEATETLFDAFIATSLPGRLAALACGLERRVKGVVKRSPRLKALAARLMNARRRKFKRPPQTPPAWASR